MDRLGYQKCFYEAQRWFNEEGELVQTQGEAIISRFPFIDSKCVFTQKQSEATPDFDGEARIYIEAKVNIGDRTL